MLGQDIGFRVAQLVARQQGALTNATDYHRAYFTLNAQHATLGTRSRIACLKSRDNLGIDVDLRIDWKS